MALIKCRECGKDISEQAKSCPNCGLVLNSNTNTYKKSIPYVLIGIVVLAFLGYKMFIAKENGLVGNTRREMWNVVQTKVKDNLQELKNPKFENISKVKFFLISENTYEAIGTVKGTDSKGLSKNETFIVTVTSNEPIKATNIEFLDGENLKDRIAIDEEINKRLENKEGFLTVQELEQKLKEQPLYVEKAVYQDAKKFSSSNSLLQAVLYNNGSTEIKNAEIGFVAWNANKKPILLKEVYGARNQYFYSLSVEDINLAVNKRYTGIIGDKYYGMRVDKDLGVSYLKAVVVSYEDTRGNKWNNPLLIDFKILYENKALS